MPYTEFQECWAYENLEPFGEKGAYLRTGILAALTANIHRDPKQRGEPFVPEDFIPTFDAAQSKAQHEANKIAQAMEAFAVANPGAVRVKPKKKPRA